MKPIGTPCVLILGVSTSFSISNPNASCYSSHTQKKAEIQFLSDDKKCIDMKEKKSLTKLEA